MLSTRHRHLVGLLALLGLVLPFRPERVEADPEVGHGFLGLSYAQQTLVLTLTDSSAPETLHGAKVIKINPDGPAAKAGVQIDDAIVKLNGLRLHEASDLLKLVSLTQPGDEITLEIIRNSSKMLVKFNVARANAANNAPVIPDAANLTQLPTYSMDLVCRWINAPKVDNSCVDSEQLYYDRMKAVWNNIPEWMRRSCVNSNGKPEGSYQAYSSLFRCLQFYEAGRRQSEALEAQERRNAEPPVPFRY